jgi:hypothetical protein
LKQRLGTILRTLDEYSGLLTAVLAALGLVAVFFQLRQIHSDIALSKANVEVANKSLQISADSNSFSSLLDVDKVFIEHPELHDYLYPDPHRPQPDYKLLTGNDHARLDAVVDLYLDFIDYTPTSTSAAKNNSDSWKAFFTSLFKNSPVLRMRLSERCDWYDLPSWDNYWQFHSQLPELCPT